MATNTLVSTIFDEVIQSDVHVEIEWEFTSQPNGRPDPRDSWSEGYDIVPEVISTKILEIEDPPVDMSKEDYMAWFKNFEEKHEDDIKDIVQDYVDSQEDDIDDDDEN